MDMITKKFDLMSDNLKLAAELFIPDTGNSPYPALCLCHGIPAAPHNPDDRGWAVLAERFCSAGFITLIFNFRGAGISQGNFDLQGWCRDLKAAINYLHTLKNVDKSRLFVLGSSAGAATAICVAAEDVRIAAVVSMASPATFSFLDRGQAEKTVQHFRSIGIIRDASFPASLDKWLEGFRSVAPIECIDQISPRPLFIIHGEKDDVVPVDNARKLYEKAGDPKEIIIIPGAGHRLRLEEKAVEAALNWLKQRARLLPQP
jgi:uncharacterized protein